MATILTVAEFQAECSMYGEIVHIKGFGRGIKADFKSRALKAIGDDCNTIAWDGDPPKKDSFTALPEIFLRARPTNRVIAFRESGKIQTFLDAWKKELDEFGSRITIVKIDKVQDRERLGLAGEADMVKSLPGSAREFFFVGRTAMVATGSRKVVAVGGGGITVIEAEASLRQGVQWTILAVSRGETEQNETLLDWAHKNPGPSVEFVQGFDPNEDKGFKASALEVWTAWLLAGGPVQSFFKAKCCKRRRA